MASYVTVVGSTTVPLIEDTPNVVQQSVMGSIVNGTNIATDLMNTLTHTYSHDVRRAYEYAKTKYYYGLPEGSIGRFVVNNDLVISVLKQFVTLGATEDISIVAANIDNLYVNNFAYEYFRNNTTEFNPTGKTLDNVTFEYYLNSEGGETSDEGVTYTTTAFTDGEIDPINETSFRLRLYAYQDRGDPNNSENIIRTWIKWVVINIDHADYNKLRSTLTDYYYYVEYYIFDKTTGIQRDSNFIWNYWVNSQRFVELNVSPDIVDQNYYMPIVPLRINNKMLTEEDSYETTRYKTSKELLNILGLDITQLTKGIVENPDVDKVDHAYVVLGANLFSEKVETIRYIHEFIKYLYGSGEKNSLTIADETYQVKLTWGNIISTIKGGSIGKINSVDKFIGKTENDIKYIRTRKQITTDTYQELTWYEPVLHNYIYKTTKSVTTTLDAINYDNSEAMIIPLNISIVTNNLTALQANTLYYDALKLVFNSYDRQKLKWYQTGLFRAVTMVIAIAISLFTYGAGAALVTALVGVVINMALTFIYDLVLKIFGDDLAPYIMAVIIIVAIYFGYTEGFIPDIGQVVNLAINTASFTFGNIISIEAEDIMSQFREFEEYAKEQMGILETAQAELDNKYQRDPLGFYGSVGMNPNQTIDQFYYSKLQLPITYGTSCYELLSNWVDTQLQLPHLTR